MASKVDSPAEAPVPENLVVIGAPVVVLADGQRMQLEGGSTLGSEERKLLGDAKLRSLHATGYLQTPEQIEAAEKYRRDQDEVRRARPRDFVNPNFGTPTATPEAIKQASGLQGPEAAAAAAKMDGGQEGEGAAGGKDAAGKGRETPVGELGLEPRLVDVLTKAKLTTVGEILAYGQAHEGLTDLEGIGEASETRIKEAIDKVLD